MVPEVALWSGSCHSDVELGRYKYSILRLSSGTVAPSLHLLICARTSISTPDAGS